MLRVRVGSCWATGGNKLDPGRGGLGYSVSLPPTDPKAYQAFVQSVVQRYSAKGVHTYAIENEPAGNSFWQGTPQQYGDLVRLGAAAVRQADPTATVLDGGLSSTTWGVVMAQDLLDQGKVPEALAAYNAYYERRFERRQADFPNANDESSLRAAWPPIRPRRTWPTPRSRSSWPRTTSSTPSNCTSTRSGRTCQR